MFYLSTFLPDTFTFLLISILAGVPCCLPHFGLPLVTRRELIPSPSHYWASTNTHGAPPMSPKVFHPCLGHCVSWIHVFINLLANTNIFLLFCCGQSLDHLFRDFIIGHLFSRHSNHGNRLLLTLHLFDTATWWIEVVIAVEISQLSNSVKYHPEGTNDYSCLTEYNLRQKPLLWRHPIRVSVPALRIYFFIKYYILITTTCMWICV